MGEERERVEEERVGEEEESKSLAVTAVKPRTLIIAAIITKSKNNSITHTELSNINNAHRELLENTDVQSDTQMLCDPGTLTQSLHTCVTQAP